MRHFHTLSAALVVAALAACSSSSESDVTTRARAVLFTVAGDSIGYVDLAEHENNDVDVDVHVDGVTPGLHGIHFHAVGLCEAGSTFSTAGGHFNPQSRQHGLSNPQGPHNGDLPNIEVASNGSGDMHTVTQRLTLTSGVLSVVEGDGGAMILHAGEDDQVTDPMGNSGARYACGVIDLLPGPD